ncbi:MAG TPA: N-formylglutamate amidohydrolase, partial [Gemmatimonadales bacterium]|nr:N-formylglutamate amidohydrolase [Gemmatimonadales bacterium]
MIAPPTPPFTILRPSGTPTLVFDSPHSGRLYPADFAVKCGRTELRRGEDAYVDELIAGAVRHGAGVLAAVYPRTYIDVNRAETDIDADLLSAPWPGPLAPTEKTERGLGLIRRYVEPGVEVNARLLAPAEVQDRIDRVYRPYHAALAALLEEAGRVRRPVWHLNWHSMKSAGIAMTPDGPGRRRAEFIVSDRDGTTADPAVTGLV